MTAPDMASQFIPSQELFPRFGFTDSAYWIRFQVHNEAESTEWLLLYDWNAFFVDYYFPTDTTEGYDVIQTGTARPFDTRAIPSSGFAFPLPVAPHQSETVHMRVESSGSLAVPLTVWTVESFIQLRLRQQAVNSFLYGIFAILVLYHIILFFMVRDTSYLYYALFFGLMLLSMIAVDGFGGQYLWPGQGTFNAIAPRLFLVLSFTFATLFADTYLRTKAFAPRLHNLMIDLVIANLWVLGLQVFWFRTTAVLNVFLLFASTLTTIVAGVVAWRRHYSPAKYYLLGWVLVFTGVILFVLTLIGWVPLAVAAYDVLRFGIVVLAVVLSYGLADRINVLRQETEAAQFEVVEQRRRIAQDLHDSVTQSLYSTNLFAEAGREIVHTGDTEAASHYFHRIGAMTQQALKEMRLFLYELRPPDVVHDGLVDALQQRLDAVESRSGIEARLILDGEVDFPNEVNDQLYRIGQEALNNIVKHANADEVTVRLRANGMMGMDVIDNGCGFDLHEARRNGGLGLRSMGERAADINADLQIETVPNQGTLIRVEIRSTDE